MLVEVLRYFADIFVTLSILHLYCMSMALNLDILLEGWREEVHGQFVMERLVHVKYLSRSIVKVYNSIHRSSVDSRLRVQEIIG